MSERPIFALRAITVRGVDYLPGDELPQPPTLLERGLATTDPVKAAALRERAALQRERREARARAYELDVQIAGLDEMTADSGR